METGPSGIGLIEPTDMVMTLKTNGEQLSITKPQVEFGPQDELSILEESLVTIVLDQSPQDTSMIESS